MQEENLFATPRRPQRLRISVERVWLAGDDVYDVQAAVTGSKSQETLWVATQRFQGDGAHLVVQAWTNARLAHFDGPGWHAEPKVKSQEEWERHLFTF